MSTAHNFEVFASEEETPDKGFRNFFGSDTQESINRLVTSPPFQSPMVDYSIIHSPDEIEQSSEIKGHTENPLKETVQEGADEEGLFDEIDPEPAETEMNKIIHLLAYLKDDGMKQNVVAEYPSIPIYQLQKYLVEQAWGAATGGPLAEILGELLDRNEKLRAKCQELQQGHIDLEQECSRLMTEDRQNLIKTMTEALGVTYVTGATSLQTLKKQIMDLKVANASLETERLTLTRKNAALANENAALSKQLLASIQKLQTVSEEN